MNKAYRARHWAGVCNLKRRLNSLPSISRYCTFRLPSSSMRLICWQRNKWWCCRLSTWRRRLSGSMRVDWQCWQMRAAISFSSPQSGQDLDLNRKSHCSFLPCCSTMPWQRRPKCSIMSPSSSVSPQNILAKSHTGQCTCTGTVLLLGLAWPTSGKYKS